jgi:release factor glutamine methyltransferase
LTLRALRESASVQFAAAGLDAPRLTAEVLLAHALRRARSYLFAHDLDEAPEGLAAEFAALVARRLAGVPTQHLTGVQEFYGRPFRVSPAALIPRPETEHVVEHALEVARDALVIADIGAGTGAIGVTLALELKRRVVLTDLSAPALWLARENALALGARCDYALGDALSPLAAKSVDLLVSNPPYIPLAERDGLACEVRDHDPALALFGGESGNEIYERIFAEAPRVLRTGGWLVLELGWQSAPAVRALAAHRWGDVSVLPDLAGHDRVFRARLER